MHVIVKGKTRSSVCTSKDKIILCKVVNLKLKVACGAFSALQPVGRLYPCPQ